jgi:polyhydroxybutyrate depolymerase
MESRWQRTTRSSAARERGRRVAGFATSALIATIVVAACAPPPTSPAPTVRPQPPGRGIVAGVDSAPSAGCDAAATLPEGRSVLRLPFNGGTRTAILDVPTPSADPAPLLLSLHPFTVGPDGWDTYSGLSAAATGRGYLVATPLGSEPGPRWAVPGGLATGVDDIGFLMALLDHLEDSACVDRNREFAAGFSAGAAMAQGLSCTLPWRMAAVAGSGGTNLTSTCPASPATDVMVLHGSADPIAPTTGSEVVFAPPLGLAVDTVVAVNAGRAGCSGTPVVDQVAPSVVVERYVGCTKRVEYWRLIGAGHTWAGSPPIIDFIAGPTNTAISATETVLDFFDQH